MPKHRFRESMKSSFRNHVHPEMGEQLKGTKKDVEDKVKKILDLINNEELEENDGFSNINTKKEPLLELIEDLHSEYENLHSKYDHLTGKLLKEIHGEREKDDSSSSSSSDSDSDPSSIEKSSKNGKLSSEIQKITDGMKQEIEALNLENDDLKRKLTTMDEDYLAALRKIKELEEHINILKVEGEIQEQQKSRLLVENGELKQKMDVASLMEAEMRQKLEDANRDKDNLILEKESVARKAEDDEKIIQDLKRVADQLKGENRSLIKEDEATKGENRSLTTQISELEQIYAERENELSVLRKQLEDSENESLSTSQNLKLQVDKILADMESLRVEKAHIEERMVSELDEASNRSKLLEEQVNSLQQELEALHGQSAELQLQLERRSQEVSDYKMQIDNANEIIARKSEDRQSLVHERDSFAAQSKHLEEELISLHKQKDELEEQLKINFVENGQLQDENARFQEQIFELEKILAEKGLELSAFQERFITAENEASSKLIALMEEKERLQGELDYFQAQVNKLELQLEREKQESLERLNEVESEKSTLLSEITDQQRLLKEQEEAYEKLTLDYKQMEVCFQECKTNLEVAERKVEEMAKEFQRNMQSKDQMIGESKAMVEDHKRNLEAIGDERTDLMNQIVDYQGKLKEQEDAYNKLMKEHEEVQISYEECKVNLEVAEGRIQESLERLNEVETQKSTFLSEINDQQRLLKEQEDAYEKLTLDYKQMEVCFQECKTNLEVAERKVEEMAEEFQRITQSKDQMIDELKAMVEDHKRNLEATGDERTDLMNQIVDYQRKLKEQEDAYNKLMKEHEEVQISYEECKVNLEVAEGRIQESLERLNEVETQKSTLLSEITDQKRLLKEQEGAYEKLTLDYKQMEVCFQECKTNLEVTERKVEEMAEEFQRNMQSKDQMIGELEAMVEDHKRNLEAIGDERTDLMNQIVDYQRKLKEEEDSYNKLMKEHEEVQISYEECKVNLEVAEGRIQERLEEINQLVESKERIIADRKQAVEDLKRDVEVKEDENNVLTEKVSNIEVKLRLSNQKLRVTEQLLTEREEQFKKAEAKFLEEQRLLEDKITTLSGIIVTNNESYCRLIKDISEKLNSTLAGFEAAVQKFEEAHVNYQKFIAETSKELKNAKTWVCDIKIEKENLEKEVNDLGKQLLTKTEQEYALKERLQQIDAKANRDEKEKENLIKSVEQLEKRVELLETMMKEKDEGIVGLGEEKREAIRQLCLWIDYHSGRCEYLKEVLSRTAKAPRQPRRT